MRMELIPQSRRERNHASCERNSIQFFCDTAMHIDFYTLKVTIYADPRRRLEAGNLVGFFCE